MADGLDIDGILEVAQPLCNTPAEYTAFIEKARSLRSTEYEVLVRLRSLASEEKGSLANFIKFNFKTLIGILEAVNAPAEIRAAVKDDSEGFLNQYDKIIALLETIDGR